MRQNLKTFKNSILSKKAEEVPWNTLTEEDCLYQFTENRDQNLVQLATRTKQLEKVPRHLLTQKVCLQSDHLSSNLYHYAARAENFHLLPKEHFLDGLTLTEPNALFLRENSLEEAYPLGILLTKTNPEKQLPEIFTSEDILYYKEEYIFETVIKKGHFPKIQEDLKEGIIRSFQTSNDLAPPFFNNKTNLQAIPHHVLKSILTETNKGVPTFGAYHCIQTACRHDTAKFIPKKILAEIKHLLKVFEDAEVQKGKRNALRKLEAQIQPEIQIDI